MDRKCLLIAWSLALVGGSGTSFAQGESPPDILVDLNEGIFYYLDGYGKQPGEGDPQRPRFFGIACYKRIRLR